MKRLNRDACVSVARGIELPLIGEKVHWDGEWSIINLLTESFQ